jgi:thioredoxin reductase
MDDEVLLQEYDVAVVGGGAAGLSAALMLARARRPVVVVDAGAPRNAPAAAVHGLLGHEGTPPAELLDRGRTEVRSYGGHVTAGEVVGATRDGDRFVVSLADRRRVRARRLLVTTGLVDELPAIEGLRERWGHDVLHCPYCHGWEVRDRPIGVIGTGPMSVHQALLFSQWSPDITFFGHTAPPLDDGQLDQLRARGIRLVTGEVAALAVADDRLAGVHLTDGTLVERDAVVVSPRMVARVGFLASLGLQAVDHPSGMGVHVPVDPTGRTTVPGVWAAGNVADLSAQVGTSAAAGALAAAHINMDLVTEDTERAITALRRTTGAPA